MGVCLRKLDPISLKKSTCLCDWCIELQFKLRVSVSMVISVQSVPSVMVFKNKYEKGYHKVQWA